MSHRQPHLRGQAKQLRVAIAKRGVSLTTGESLELVARLNGYPSWNVASCDNKPLAAEEPGTKLQFQVWTGVHHHRHGEDTFLFTFPPTEADVIERVKAASSWEPEENESVEVLGVETFEIDVPHQMAKQCAKLAPSLIGVYEVDMSALVDYTDPEDVPEWSWVEDKASFSHKGNGNEGGVWEFMVHWGKFFDMDARQMLDGVPELLRAPLGKAMELGAVWVMFHQG